MRFHDLLDDNLYEIINKSNYPTIRKLCTANKNILSLCRTNPLIRNIIKQKKLNAIEKTDGFLENFEAQYGYFKQEKAPNIKSQDFLLYLRYNLTINGINTFLKEVVDTNDSEILDELINRGLNPSEHNNKLITEASENGHIIIVDRLLEDSRVDPTAFNNFPLQFAVIFGHLHVVNRLLQDPRVDPTANKNAVIQYASNQNKVNIVQRLLEDKRVWNSLTSGEKEKYLKQK